MLEYDTSLRGKATLNIALTYQDNVLNIPNPKELSTFPIVRLS